MNYKVRCWVRFRLTWLCHLARVKRFSTVLKKELKIFDVPDIKFRIEKQYLASGVRFGLEFT